MIACRVERNSHMLATCLCFNCHTSFGVHVYVCANVCLYARCGADSLTCD